MNFAYIDSNKINYGYPLPDTNQFRKVKGTSDIFLRIAHAALGVEYAFQPNKNFIPFIGLDFNLNIIWELYRQSPIDSVFNPNETTVSFTIKGVPCFGIGIGAGAQLRLANSFGLTWGFKYKLANLIGKDSEKTKTAAEDRKSVV